MQRVSRVAGRMMQRASRVAGVATVRHAASQRYQDPWWRQYDTPEQGFQAAGFVNRLPLRLESTEVMVHGFADADKMWADFPNEEYIPMLCGGKAVVSFWFNNFKDTDCGGEYLETWYNTYVTPKDQPQVDVPMEAGPMAVAGHPDALSFLQRVVCGDTPKNPGAAQKAINGGRQLWGFSKHRDTGELSFEYDGQGDMKFNARHLGKQVVSLACRLPEADEGAITFPMDVVSAQGGLISCPKHSGQVDNMGRQTRYSVAMKATMNLKPWDPKTDALVLGEDDFYAPGPKSWGFVPILKAHSPDFKIVAWGPLGYLSADATAAAVAEHERKLATGVLGGTL